MVATLALLANNALAGGGPPPVSVPDGGSTALLAVVSMFGLAVGRKVLR